MEAVSAAQRPHRVAELVLYERVHEHGTASAGARCGELDVVDARDPRVADDLEILVRELALDGLGEARCGLSGRV